MLQWARLRRGNLEFQMCMRLRPPTATLALDEPVLLLLLLLLLELDGGGGLEGDEEGEVEPGEVPDDEDAGALPLKRDVGTCQQTHLKPFAN